MHGLGGDPFKTWRHGDDNKSSFPHWLGNDFPQIGVWSLDYAASPTRLPFLRKFFARKVIDRGQAMSLERRALQTVDLLVQRGIGQRPIVFICHSLGGLLTKEVLRTCYDDATNRYKPIFLKTKAVLFLATPHSGSDVATFLSAFPLIFGATVSVDDLRSHHAHLENLYNWYCNHAGDVAIETSGYYEQRSIRGVTVVSSAFAHPGVGHNPIPLDEDHISIAKPLTRNAQVYVAAHNLIADLLGNSRSLPNPVLIPEPPRAPTPEPPAPSPAQPNNAWPIPHELPPGAEQFFGRAPQLEELKKRLREHKTTAVVGPAGIGKTALAARALQEVFGALSSKPASSLFPGGVVYIDLYALKAVANTFWDTLAGRLTGPQRDSTLSSRQQAEQACRNRSFLLVVEGGEEANGKAGRDLIGDLLSVLHPENRYLLLTRSSHQALPTETIHLRESLSDEDAAALFDSITKSTFSEKVRAEVLTLLQGHPLAINWAANLLLRGDDSPESFITEWKQGQLPAITDPDPKRATHTLSWLFSRSVRDLDPTEAQALEACALLAPTTFPFTAITAALAAADNQQTHAVREALRSLTARAILRPAGQDSWQFTHVLGYRFARKESGSDPLLRSRLGDWLEQEFRSTIHVPNADRSAIRVDQNLEHLAALLRTDDNASLWQPLAEKTLYDHLSRLSSLGRLSQASIALDAVKEWLSRIEAQEPANEKWLREKSRLFDAEGEIHTAQGDLAGAFVFHQQSLQIRQRLAASDPSNNLRQRDLSISFNRLGAVQLAQGHFDSALASFQKSLQIRQTLADANPSVAMWQRDLSISLDRVGDTQLEQKDLPGALLSYQKALKIRQALADSDPTNTLSQRDLSLSMDRVGNIQSAQGNHPGALASYLQSLQTREALAAADLANTERQFDVSISLDKVGGNQLAKDDLAGALISYEKSYEIRKKLCASEPSNTDWQRGLSLSMTRLAQLHESKGEKKTALRYAKESLVIDERLSALDPTNVIWQRDVEISRVLVGSLQ